MLVCNCRRVVSRGEGAHAEYRVVKSRKWDCPSCGLDRKRTLALMCGTAGACRMITLTLEQPRAVWVGCERTPGEAPPGVFMALEDGTLVPGEGWHRTQVHRPDRHVRCDPSTHLAWNVRHGGYRWRVMPDCAHCLRWLSAALGKWVKRVRRLYPDFQYLHAREVHKSGGVHLHVAVTGIPRAVRQRTFAGLELGRNWREVGGGFIEVGRPGDNTGTDAGWYVGKYLAKQHDNKFAPGFRRWSRGAGFAPEVRMGWTDPNPSPDGGWADPGAPTRLGGWVHPDGTEQRWRWFHDVAEMLERNAQAREAAGRSEAKAVLDPSTANSPQFCRDSLRMWDFRPPVAAVAAAVEVLNTWESPELF